MSIPLSVKWSKDTFDLEVDPSLGMEAFQAQLFSLTGVPADRQKIMSKGKFLRESADLAKLSAGAKLMLMGSAETLPAAPSKPVVFEEDLSESQKVSLAHKAPSSGLHNLGNTCYMNSTLQAFRVIPELKQGLIRFANEPGRNYNDLGENLTTQLGRLYKDLDSTAQPVTPVTFTTVFRQAFPQFAERTQEGQYAQQDADEALTQLLNTVAQKAGAFHGPDNETKENMIDYVFGGELEYVLRNTEDPTEPVRRGKEKFTKLRCTIDENVNFMFQGIGRDLEELSERHSEKFGRTCVYKKTSRISKMPRYLIVQYVRFFWRRDTQLKAKILRKVEFPVKFDMTEFLSPQMKRSVLSARRALKEEEDKKLGLASLDRSKNMVAIREQAKKNLQREREKEKEKEEKEKKETDEFETIDPSTPYTPVPTSGFYDLFSVVTHKGRSADSGHYVGWARNDVTSDKWLKYDDDVVSEVNTDEVKNLSGGGDWHMVYILMYKRNDDFKGKTLPALQAAESTSEQSNPSNNINTNNAASDAMTDAPPSQ